MPLISLFKFVNWITGTPTPIEDGVSSAFTLPLQQEIIDAMNQAPFLASGANHRAGFVPDPGPTPGSPLRFLREDSTWAQATFNPFSNAALPYFYPQGRLTLSTTEVVMTSSYAAASSLYYYPYVGSTIPYYDGSASWNLYNMGNAPLATFVLDGNSGHTGYHQAGKIFDVYFDYNAGSGRLVTSPAWTSNSVRSNAIVRAFGLWVNNASITCRFGTGSGDTASFAAGTLTYLGSFYCLADGQTGFIYGGAAVGGSPSYFALWNCYNRKYISGGSYESTDSWTVSNTTPAAFNGSISNANYFLQGLVEDSINVWAGAFGEQSAVQFMWAGIGLNSTSAAWAPGSIRNPSTTQIGEAGAIWSFASGMPTLGWNYTQLLQAIAGTGSNTMYGDNGNPPIQQSGIVTGIFT